MTNDPCDSIESNFSQPVTEESYDVVEEILDQVIIEALGNLNYENFPEGEYGVEEFVLESLIQKV
jgi:hypothetical protein